MFGFGAGSNSDYDCLFASTSVCDLQRLVELVPCSVRFGKSILLQFASNLCNLFLNVLQLAHDHRERGLCFQMLQVR